MPLYMLKETSRENKILVQNLSWPSGATLSCKRGQEKSVGNSTSSEVGFELVNDMPIFMVRRWNNELLLKRFLLRDINMKFFAGFLSGPYKSTCSTLWECDFFSSPFFLDDFLNFECHFLTVWFCELESWPLV